MGLNNKLELVSIIISVFIQESATTELVITRKD